MNSKRENVIVGIIVINKKYCADNCSYITACSGFYCNLLGDAKKLKFDNKVALPMRSRICMLKEIRIKKNKN